MQVYNNNSYNKYNGEFYVVCPRCKNVVAGKFCNQCGLNLSETVIVPPSVYPTPPQTVELAVKPAKKNILIPIVITISVLFIVLAIVLGIIYSKSIISDSPMINDNHVSTPIKDYVAGGVSLDEYKKLQTGMSYAHISAIIGGDGTLVEQGTDIHDQTYYQYCWIGENNSSTYVYITFTNDAASDITVNGNL